MAFIMKTAIVKNFPYIGFFFVLVIFVFLLFAGYTSFVVGLFISMVSLVIHYMFYFYYKNKVSSCASQTLLVFVKSVVIRFFLVGCLLILAFQNPNLAAKPLLIGFILGQIFFNSSLIGRVNNVK